VKHEFIIPLTPGQHVITVKADTDVSYGLSDPLEEAGSPEKAGRPKQYVLAIGIRRDLQRSSGASHAAEDAAAIVRRLTEGKEGIYTAVETRLLTNAQATRRNVLVGLEWMQQNMTPADVGMVYFEGLPSSADLGGRFGLATADVQTSDVLTSRVAGEELKPFVRQTAGRLLLWIDIHRTRAAAERTEANSCQGGTASASSSQATFSDLLRELADPEYGAIVAGTHTDGERADAPAGVFAEAIMAALSKAADIDADGNVSLSEFQRSLQSRVHELSGGRHHAVQGQSGPVRSFPLIIPKE
jgi:uncharacterized caspase-like protein